ncbi:SusC/RagA family TonB-linked outer membrane protein [Gillisia sp. Q332]|uniref:SusC/RagA family TonB-linked outer membrane protein n=1 Tax=Gillisia xinjiangensis TaxID=3384765 RepID=UPI003919F207
MSNIKKAKKWKYSLYGKYVLSTGILLLFLLSSGLYAESKLIEKPITGTVVDDITNQPIAGALVIVKGTQKGAVTDFDGKFTLSAPVGATTLIVSYLGYSSKEVDVGDGTNLIIRLSEDASTLDQVIITALGVTKSKEKVSYAAQTLKAETINQSRIGDISQQLSGQVSGLSVRTNNGSAVSSSRIVLRGETSLNPNKNQPLIVIDGVLISNTYIGIGSNPVSSDLPVDYGNSLNDLNPDDYATITVLKGPKAAALYGERGTNGALIITTKSGKNTEGVGVSYTTGVSIDKVNRFWDEQYEYGGGGPLGADFNQYRSNWGGNFGPRTDGQLIAQGTPNNPNPEPTPFLQRADREGFFETGVSYNNNLSFSFADDKSYGRVSLGRISKEGIVPNTDYNKTNVGIRLGSNLTEKLTIDLSANYVNSNSGNVPDIGYNSGGLMYSMLWVMKNFSLDDYRDYWLPNQENQEQNYFLNWGTNPYLIVNENLNGFKHNRIFGNFKTNYEFNDNLSAFVRIGLDTYEDRRQSRRASGQPAFRDGMYREQDVRLQELNLDMLATYTKDITDKFNLEVNAGASIYEQIISNKIAQTNSLAIPGIYSLGNAADKPALTQVDTKKKLNSVYGTVELGYDQKIFFDVTGRNDWSSTLPRGNQSFFYPSVGLSGVISKMAKLPDFISYLKLRTSYAQTGNSTDPGVINNSYNLGIIPGSVTNPIVVTDQSLKSEKTDALEFGVELRLLHNRLNFEIDFYDYSTTNQILTAPISQSSGVSFRRFNAGEINSKGIEVLLTAKPIVSKAFNWVSTFNFAKSKSEVVSLADGIETLIIASGPNGATIEARPGGRMGDIYGRGYERDPQGNIILQNIGGLMRPKIGKDIKKVGNYNPDWTLGMTNNFQYKNLNLNIFLDYRNGGDFYSLTGSQLYRSGSITETLPYRTENFVPNGVVDNGNGSFTQNTQTTSGYDWYRSNWDASNIEANTYDSTFLKLREISLGIDLKPYFENSLFEKISFSLFGRNLATWTKDDFVRHFDPEVLSFTGSSFVPGFEIGQLPGAATYGFNLNVSF